MFKKFLILLLLHIAICDTYSQYSYNEGFDSFGGSGEWTKPSTPTNTGSHSGNLCVNTSGTYYNSTTYDFVSPSRVYTDCGVNITVTWSLVADMRNNKDYIYFQYNDGTWKNIAIYTGAGTVTPSFDITNTATQFRIRFITGSSGSTTGNYIHVDYFNVLCASPLPVVWLSFTARTELNKAILEWSTASEVNNDYFEIEKSYNALEWIYVNRVDGMGNTNNISNYIYEDFSNIDLYYRLKQVDYDGKLDYSKLIFVRFGKPLKVEYYDLTGRDGKFGFLIEVQYFDNNQIITKKVFK